MNNAGFAGSTAQLDQHGPLEWQRIVEVNLVGRYHVSRLVDLRMRKTGIGRIVSTVSLAGGKGTANASGNSAGKTGVIAATKALGKELAKNPILVNGIAPAAIETPQLTQMSPRMCKRWSIKARGVNSTRQKKSLILHFSSALFRARSVRSRFSIFPVDMHRISDIADESIAQAAMPPALLNEKNAATSPGCRFILH